MKKALLSLLVIGVVGTVAYFGYTRAFFSDTETSKDNTFEAGALDLKVDNTSYYNGLLNEGTTWQESDLPGHFFFDFADLKPSDWGEDTISLHVNDNDAWVCMNIKLTANDDNTCTEPEKIDDTSCTEPGSGQGELAGQLNFIFWVDDGDNVFEANETVWKQGTAQNLLTGQTWPLADSSTNLWSGNPGPMLGATTYYIGKAWCFGNLQTAPLDQDGKGIDSPRTPANSSGGVSCDGKLLNNASQTDLVKADVEFSVMQSRHNPNFRCVPLPTPTPTPTPTPSPTPIVCVTTYVSDIVLNNQGTRKDNGPIPSTRINPANMFGLPNGPAEGTFFSLGKNGSVIVTFASPVYDVNGTGTDLSFHEITNGRSGYPLEKASVEVSADNITYYPLVGEVSSEPPGDGVMFLDFSTTGLSSIQYIKLIDTTDYSLNPNSNADGYDVDAIDATCGTGQQ